MIQTDRLQFTLDKIANDLKRWHQNRDLAIPGILNLYTQDLIIASENLENLIEDDLGRAAYVRLMLGEAAAIGTKFESAPMQSVYVQATEAVPYSAVALDRVQQINSVENGRRIYERHFGNGVIYFTSRQLATALNGGASLSVEDADSKPDHWSYETVAE